MNEVLKPWENGKAILLPAATQSPPAKTSDLIQYEPVYRCMDDVVSQPVQWLWEGVLARGKITMVAGDPGLGKSQFTAFVASVISTGGTWPVSGAGAEPGNVVLFSAEDDAADTIKPRLEACNADHKRIFVFDGVLQKKQDNSETERSFDLARDIAVLEDTVLKEEGTSLVIIDPISAYLGEVNSHNNAEVRGVLKLLADLAVKHHLAILLISHLNKNEQNQAINRVNGSGAFTATARIAYIVGRDASNRDNRLFVPIKSNISVDSQGYSFQIVGSDLPDGIRTSRIVWGEDYLGVTADEVLQQRTGKPKGSALLDASQFLQTILADGPVATKEIAAEAKNIGISASTLRRAMKEMHIVVKKAGMKGGWKWELPVQVIRAGQEALFEDSPEDAHQATKMSISE